MTTSRESGTAAQELYDNAAAIYDRYNKDTTTTIARFMLSLAPRSENDAIVLDNACGTGALTFALLESFQPSASEGHALPTIHAVDIAPAMTASVVQKSQTLSVPDGVLQTAVMDAQSLSFADNTFTHSYMNFGIFFLPDAARGAAEIYRTLKPGGAAFISTWQSLGYLDLLRASQRIVRPQDSEEELFRPMYSEVWFTEEKLRGTLVAGGFPKERITVYTKGTKLVGDDIQGLVETMLLPFGKKMEGWSGEERVRLKEVIVEGLSVEDRETCSVDMVAFVAVAMKE
ncbi:S-adenosyl-L-methionine-dependent methyltransferase [Aspergillus carlsbadensis]|nr:S-adenosyl-L-methionine-dependent methyltransferase [Aspergillus carlsbadensis]